MTDSKQKWNLKAYPEAIEWLEAQGKNPINVAMDLLAKHPATELLENLDEYSPELSDDAINIVLEDQAKYSNTKTRQAKLIRDICIYIDYQYLMSTGEGDLKSREELCVKYADDPYPIENPESIWRVLQKFL